ncbi:Sulfate adenylyltransferase [Durusdinium trenchii]|uniref:Sulfate adenylyltransferase n=1 Tax=Durusdinium trenchii TaxID=1381693 RepID=A0ABP0HI83_9DINO
MRSPLAIVLLLGLVAVSCPAFCGPALRHWQAGRVSGIARGASEEDPDAPGVPAWRTGIAGRKGALGFLGGLLLVILYISSKDQETRNLKLCVRSKKFEEDFFNDPKKAAWAESKGYKALQDPNCVEWPEFWERLKPF